MGRYKVWIRALLTLTPEELVPGRMTRRRAKEATWSTRRSERQLCSPSCLMSGGKARSSMRILLRKAIDAEDEGRVAEFMSTSFSTALNVDQKKDLAQAAGGGSLEARSDGSARSVEARAKDWLLGDAAACRAAAGALIGGERLKDKIGQRPSAKADRGKGQYSFYENLDKAANGDDLALKSLVDTYGAPALPSDFMASQKDFQNGDLAVRLARTLGWHDVNGNTHLDLNVEAPAASPAAQPASQTWTLGKTDDEIRKALHGFDSPGDHAAGSPVTPSAFQRTTLSPTPIGKRRSVISSRLGEAGGHCVVPYSPHVLFPGGQEILRCQRGGSFQGHAPQSGRGLVLPPVRR